MAELSGYPQSVVEQVIPNATITAVIQGSPNTLVGTNLNDFVELGVTGLADIKAEWKYNVVKLEDGSGFVITEWVKVTPTAGGQSSSTSKTTIVVNNAQFNEHFRHREYWTQVALYTSQWFYDWLYKNYSSPVYNQMIHLYPGGYDFYNNQLRPWNPQGAVTMGPIMVIEYNP
ncbi:hypothetical protein [Pelagicoccus enzymogenes]|uniref:hypothetical protein n=1 Tax=Pelagicoccus enzymogenes TaxID=2773457 RepID=UPI002810C9E4|nr:hypothetical protein [Pelagicoccus enzymogenes]